MDHFWVYIYSWVRRYNNTGFFDINDNRTNDEKELIELRKELISEIKKQSGNDSEGSVRVCK